MSLWFFIHAYNTFWSYLYPNTFFNNAHNFCQTGMLGDSIHESLARRSCSVSEVKERVPGTFWALPTGDKTAHMYTSYSCDGFTALNRFLPSTAFVRYLWLQTENWGTARARKNWDYVWVSNTSTSLLGWRGRWPLWSHLLLTFPPGKIYLIVLEFPSWNQDYSKFILILIEDSRHEGRK